jgi:hypothetical protein
MLKLLITLLISFLIVSCNTSLEEEVIRHGTQTEVCTVILYRARSPTTSKEYIIKSIRSYYIHLYLLSKGLGFTEGSEIVPSGVEPHQRVSINRRDLNFIRSWHSIS